MPFPVYSTAQFPTSLTEPWGICYDNAGHVWSCDTVAGVIQKIDTATLTILDTVAIPGGDARGCCYDAGTNSVWAVCNGGHTVTKIDAVTDAVIGTYAIGSGGAGLISDGVRIWVCNENDNDCTVLLAATGAFVATVATGNSPLDITFDGVHIWTVNQFSSTITKITAATQAPVGTYPVGSQPIGIAFDGTNIWVSDGGYNPTFLQSLERIDAGTGAVLNTYPLGDDGTLDDFAGLAWDVLTGILWLCNARGNPGNNQVIAIDVSNGTIIATYNGYPQGNTFLVCIAGAQIWASNNNFGFLTVLSPVASRLKPPNYYPSEIPGVVLPWECCIDPFLGCILER